MAREIGSAAVLAVRRGEIVYSYGEVTRNLPCHSIRKPFLGALYGIYRERGVIEIDATIAELGIDDSPAELTKSEKQARIRDLLAARSGIYHPAAGEVPAMERARPERGSHPPDTHYYYNNWDFNALGTIFREQTGEDIFEAFEREIAEPIGMQDFSAANCRYSYEYTKSEHPAYFFKMSARDMARFGQLMAAWGEWDGRQIIPREWIELSTVPYSAKGIHNDPYGYLWCIIPAEQGLGRGFYHTGMSVHLLAIFPDLDLVLVHRVDTTTAYTTTYREVVELMEQVLEIALEESSR
jgi:CubicO group peptidase (beta-lactamase class C family)